MSQSPNCEPERAVPITHLSCGSMGGGEMPSPASPISHQHLTQVGELALRSCELESYLCPSSAAALVRVAPMLCLGNTVELALKVGEIRH